MAKRTIPGYREELRAASNKKPAKPAEPAAKPSGKQAFKKENTVNITITDSDPEENQ